MSQWHTNHLKTTAIAALLLLGWGAAAKGDVVVLANRTGRAIDVRVLDGLLLGPPVTIAPLDTVPIPTNGPCDVEVSSGSFPQRYALSANAAYYFGSLADGRVAMQQIGLGGDAETLRGRKLPGRGRDVATIRVKLLVDEEEPELEQRWQQRVRRRVEAASAVLERYCRVRLDVVAFDTWNSDDRTNDFRESMAEFERQVNPRPATLAIGFSSQYQVPEGRTHMGGTRGPLHSHILLREFARRLDEPVRVELLVHELGHHLGAAHSPEATSAMRPILGNQRQQKRGPQPQGIQFDPVNTLAMYLVGEELRHRNVQSFVDLTPDTKKRLRQIYTELSRANPKDESVKRFLQLVRHREMPSPLEHATRLVLQAVVAAAHREDGRAANADGAHAGDRLAEQYVRAAANTAARLDPHTARSAFLLGLGMALDDERALRGFPRTSEFVQSVETESMVKERLEVLGKPTLNGRADLTKHFFISAYLTAAIGSRQAELTGEAKELLDANTDSGYSFVDMAANRSGILFARRVLDRSLALDDVARHFTVEAFLPNLDGLDEGLSRESLREKYGGKSDQRYRAQISEIDRRIEALPAYRALDAGPD